MGFSFVSLDSFSLGVTFCEHLLFFFSSKNVKEFILHMSPKAKERDWFLIDLGETLLDLTKRYTQRHSKIREAKLRITTAVTR